MGNDLLLVSQIGGLVHPLVDGSVGEDGNEHPGKHNSFAANFVGKPAKDHKKRGTHQQGNRHQTIRLHGLDVADFLDKTHRIELPRVPDHALSHGSSKQSQQHKLEVISIAKTLFQRVGGRFSFGFRLRKQG